MSAYDSFITRAPSRSSVEAITAVTVYRISWKDLQIAYDNTPKGEKIGRISSEGVLLSKLAREYSLLIDTPQERYEKLVKMNPDWIQKVPLKYIASYIGVTPQALSRIRRRIY